MDNPAGAALQSIQDLILDHVDIDAMPHPPTNSHLIVGNPSPTTFVLDSTVHHRILGPDLLDYLSGGISDESHASLRVRTQQANISIQALNSIGGVSGELGLSHILQSGLFDLINMIVFEDCPRNLSINPPMSRLYRSIGVGGNGRSDFELMYRGGSVAYVEIKPSNVLTIDNFDGIEEMLSREGGQLVIDPVTGDFLVAGYGAERYVSGKKALKQVWNEFGKTSRCRTTYVKLIVLTNHERAILFHREQTSIRVSSSVRRFDVPTITEPCKGLFALFLALAVQKREVYGFQANPAGIISVAITSSSSASTPTVGQSSTAVRHSPRLTRGASRGREPSHSTTLGAQSHREVPAVYRSPADDFWAQPPLDHNTMLSVILPLTKLVGDVHQARFLNCTALKSLILRGQIFAKHMKGDASLRIRISNSGDSPTGDITTQLILTEVLTHGAVWDAYRIQTQSSSFNSRHFVLKIASPHHVSNEYSETALRSCIQHEVKLHLDVLAHLQGTMIPTVYGLFTGIGGDGSEYWAMLVEDVGTAVDIRDLRYDDKEAILTLYRSLHDAGVAHRDVKWNHWPVRVINGYRQFRLIDFSHSLVRGLDLDVPEDHWAAIFRAELEEAAGLLQLPTRPGQEAIKHTLLASSLGGSIS